ncbi:hypothetical protein [Komagataeibacter xylinus]|uniref:hypothetical protein n=1 Tax=Komagataeibacter xylinus TaxID=28448 RepID=UPI00280BF27F|nr:hypothetical protein [Komagataeibacter xylinus]
MATLKGEVLTLCKEIAKKFENWEFSSEQFKNKSLKHTTLIVGLGLGFRRVGSRGEVTVFPSVYLNNKKTMSLCKKILGRPIYTSGVFFEEIRCELTMLPEFAEYTPCFIQDRVGFIHDGGPDEPYWRDISELPSVIERFLMQGISFFERHYDFSSEKNMLEFLPAKYKVSSSGGYREYEQSQGVMLCIIHCILGDFEFVRRYRSDEYKAVFPKKTDDLDKIIECLPQMEKSWREKGYVSV